MERTAEELIHLAQNGDRNASEELVLRNSGLIWSIARRFFGRGVDPDDLYQLGCVGFIKAINGFDLSYGTQFSTYAVPKITGEIRRFLRDDGSIKVSRSMKERAYTIRQARGMLEQQLGREPTLSEIASETGLLPEEIAACESAVAATDSLQRETGEDGLTLEHLFGDFGQEEKLIEHVSLTEALAQLPPKEQMVVKLRYYRGMTQQAASKILNVSQVQISRLERRAMDRLRELLS